MNNDLINELNNKIDAQDKIINTQVLEISRLNNLKTATDEAQEIIIELQQRIDKAKEYIKSWVLDEYSIAVIDKKDDDCCYYEPNAREKLLSILGDKE